MLKRVYLEITNSCNLNCPFCTNEKGNVFLDIKTIENYILQIKKHCDYIYLHILGEPLLHPDFEKILTILDKNNLKLQLVTNGTQLNKYPNILNHTCLRKLSISVHSINNKINNNEYFSTIEKLINNNSTNIELRFYDYNNLSDEIKSFLIKLKDEYKFLNTSKRNSYKLKENVYVYFEEIFKWPNINDEIISNYGKCHGAIDMLAINCNSDVTICCLDPKAYNTLGNLKNESLDKIIESEKYKKIVQDFKENKINLELCKRCTYRLKF